MKCPQVAVAEIVLGTTHLALARHVVLAGMTILVHVVQAVQALGKVLQVQAQAGTVAQALVLAIHQVLGIKL